MNYYDYMNACNGRTSAVLDAAENGQLGAESGTTSNVPSKSNSGNIKTKSLADHDKQFHPNGYKPGDHCKFREALEEYGDTDDFASALNFKQSDNPYYLTPVHSSARLVKPLIPPERGYKNEVVMRAVLPEGHDPTKELEAMYSLAEQNVGTLNTITDNTAKAIGAEGMYRPPNNAYKGLPIKTWVRAKQKADTWYRKNDGSLGDYTQLNDLIGTTLVLKDNDSYADALERLDENTRKMGAKIAQIKPLNLTTGDDGYRDLKVTIQFPNGGTGEVIIMEDTMKKQKFENEGHAAYEAYRIFDGLVECGDKSAEGLKRAVDGMMDMLYERNATKIDEQKFEKDKKDIGVAINRILANPDSFMAKMPESFRPELTNMALRQKFFEQEREDNLAAIRKVMQKDPNKGNTSRWDRMKLVDPRERITPGVSTAGSQTSQPS